MKRVLFAMSAAVAMFAACRNSNGPISANIEVISGESVSGETAARTDSVHRAVEAKLLNGLMNKKIESLDTIIPYFGGSDTKVVLVTSRFDCVSCVAAGF